MWRCLPEMDIRSEIERMAPVSSFILLIAGSDRASGDERADLEAQHAFRQYQNVGMLWKYCCIHDGQHHTADTLANGKILDRCHQLSKLCKHVDYIDQWLIGTILPCIISGVVGPGLGMGRSCPHTDGAVCDFRGW